MEFRFLNLGVTFSWHSGSTCRRLSSFCPSSLSVVIIAGFPPCCSSVFSSTVLRSHCVTLWTWFLSVDCGLRRKIVFPVASVSRDGYCQQQTHIFHLFACAADGGGTCVVMMYRSPRTTAGVSSLLLQCGFQGLNSCDQAVASFFTYWAILPS